MAAEWEAREPEWTGSADFKWISGSGGLIKGMLGGLLFGPKSQWCCYMVNSGAVDAAKKQASGVPFVSTNDVLTSHFCKASGARVCMMTMNLRDRSTGLSVTDANAGSYEQCLLLDPANYDTPAAIRKCLSAGVPYTRQTDSAPLPGLCGSCPMAFISNWASFPWELALDGVSAQKLHLPCMAMPDMMDVALVFKPQPATLAMIYLAKRATPATLKGADGLLGDAVDSGVFPGL